ncbi:MAG: cyanophycin synthetase [Patescibacteria group bacterium]
MSEINLTKTMDFESAQKYLENFLSYENVAKIPYGSGNFDLQRVKFFLREYKVDYAKLKFVHVAGSKGKGTVSGLIANYLWKSGYKVGLYTSPDMFDVRERFWLNGKNIGKNEFASYVFDFKKFIENIDAQGGKFNLTWFEILTVIALKFFVDKKVDYAVLEVGLGGRLDATNIVKPKLSVVTTVELEHVGILGNNLSEILNEKLGIVKKGVPALIGYQTKEGLDLVKKKLKGVSKVFYVDELISEPDLIEGRLDTFVDKARLLNANVALAALVLLLKNVGLDLFLKVLKGFKLLGRFDVRKMAGKTVVFDMAHTKNSMENLVDGLRQLFPAKKLCFLMSIMKGKDVAGMLKEVAKIADKIVFSNSHVERGLPAVELAKTAKKLNLNCEIEVISDCLTAYKNLIKKNQLLVVTGSHFLVAKILKTL